MTEREQSPLGLDQPAVYQIRVPGRFDESWSEIFEGMVITVDKEATGPTITTLTGVVADQAALHGLLRQLYGLGLPLLAVNRIEGDPDEGLWRIF
ncbi:MAG: hypothetical protein JXB47_04235 [Anaerolineae bacterium]|nr:hypothetical protein [Anaerolineae bacterium]